MPHLRKTCQVFLFLGGRVRPPWVDIHLMGLTFQVDFEVDEIWSSSLWWFVAVMILWHTYRNTVDGRNPANQLMDSDQTPIQKLRAIQKLRFRNYGSETTIQKLSPIQKLRFRNYPDSETTVQKLRFRNYGSETTAQKLRLLKFRDLKFRDWFGKIMHLRILQGSKI